MSEHLGHEELRADTLRQVAKLMAAAAITELPSTGTLPIGVEGPGRTITCRRGLRPQ